MAALTSANYTVLKEEGEAEKMVLYRIRGVDSLDTIDVSGKFVEVKAATFIASGDLTGVGTVGINTTTLTLTLTNMADDAAYLLVVGQAAL